MRKANCNRSVPNEDVIVTESAASMNKAIVAFDTPVEEGKDFISGLPNEILDQIASYVILDTDPERAVRKRDDPENFREKPHVLLSLAAMSRRFHAVVEHFSRLHLAKHKDVYEWRSRKTVTAPEPRRSARLATKPKANSRIYRKELVDYLQTFCFGCDGRTNRRAVIYAGVSCCDECERKEFPDQICLTDALKRYDLRDYMIIKSRKPGPRAKHTSLPPIPYGTVKTGTPLLLGHVMSYRFFIKDVKQIARLVHGDIDAHMNKKTGEKTARRKQQLRKVKRELKIRHHGDQAEKAETMALRRHHAKRLKHYKALDPRGDLEAGWMSDNDYGHYRDLHDRLCCKVSCRGCRKDKLLELYQKHHGWWDPYMARDMADALCEPGLVSDDDDDDDWYY